MSKLLDDFAQCAFYLTTFEPYKSSIFDISISFSIYPRYIRVFDVFECHANWIFGIKGEFPIENIICVKRRDVCESGVTSHT